MALHDVEGVRDGTVLTIANRSDAERAAASATWLSRPRFEAVRIDVEHVDGFTAASLSAQIRKLFNDCGCAWGEVILAVALITVVLGPPLAGWPAGLGWGRSIAICVVAAVAGKLAGLAWSRRRVRQLLRRLAATSS